MLAEVLHCFSRERDFNQALRLFNSLDVIEISNREIAIQAARNFRRLRELGVTVCKTVDTLIATRCIEDSSRPRDFEPFVQHLGLNSALSQA